MKIDYNWMTRYAALYLTTPDGSNPSVEEFCEKLTKCGHHIEGITHITPEKDGVSEENYSIDIRIPRRRHDLNSMMWTAKECAGIYHVIYKEMARYPFYAPKKQNPNKPLKPTVTLTSKSKQCKLLVARHVHHMTNNPSPDWLKNMTVANGFKSRGILFDLIIQSTRQLANPIYMFDAAKLPSLNILAEDAKEDGIIVSDGVDYPYYKGECVLTCEGKVISVYGVVIDDSVAVTEDSHRILFLSAIFDRDRTRECFYRLNPPIKDYNNLVASCQLSPVDSIREVMTVVNNGYYADETFGEMEDIVLYCKYDMTRTITDFTVEEINEMLDTDYTAQEIVDALNNPELDTIVKENGELEVSFPSYREDTSICDIAQTILVYNNGCERMK